MEVTFNPHLKTAPLTLRSKTKKAGGFQEKLQGSEEAPSNQESSSLFDVSPLTVVSSFAALRPDQKFAEKALEKGKDLLDQLDLLRKALLTGSMGAEIIERLRSLGSEMNTLDLKDERVINLLYEIDVLSAVEVAKYEKMVGIKR